MARGRATPRRRLHPFSARKGQDGMNGFSFRRLRALLRKEWLQVTRDPMTLRLIIVLPVLQLLLFGYAINANPRNLPAGLLMAQPSKYERTIITALRNTGYYQIR